MEVFSILAPLMEGTEGLKKAEEAFNLAKIGAMFDLMRGGLDLLLVATIISRQSAIKLTIYLKKNCPGASMSNQEVEDFKSSLEKLPVEQVSRDAHVHNFV